MESYNQYKKVAEWLNTLGYDIDLDKAGLWLEDNRFTEHKTKDVIELILAWSEQKIKIIEGYKSTYYKAVEDVKTELYQNGLLETREKINLQLTIYVYENLICELEKVLRIIVK